MSSVDWYFARGNKQSGPVSSTDLKRLADSAELRPDDLVWREGLAEWVLARSVRGLFDVQAKPTGAEAPAKPAEKAPPKAEPIAEKPAPMPAPPVAAPRRQRRRPGDVFLDGLRTLGSEAFLAKMATFFRSCGLYGLIAAMLLIAVLAAVGAANGEVLGSLLGGAISVVVLAALAYTARLSCDALERQNRSVIVGLPSNALPNCVAIVSLAAGVVALLSAIGAAAQSSEYTAIPLAAASFVVAFYFALTALNLPALNVHISAGAQGGRLGEEAVSVLAWLAKCAMHVVPVAFGVGVIAALLGMCCACYQALAGDGGILAALPTAAAATWTGVASAALPLAAYLFFLLVWLVVDLCGALLQRRGEAIEPPKNEEPNP